MILPQSKTFTVLKTRLDCVNITGFNMPLIEEVKAKDPEEIERNKKFVIKCLEMSRI